MKKVGIDIGATSTRVGLVDEANKVQEVITFDSIVDDLDKEIAKVNEIVTNYEKKYGEVKTIGFACPGPLDLNKGEILKAPNLPGWRFKSITDAFKKAMPKYNFYLDNDANVAAYGQWMEYKKPYSLFYVTVSTGVGSGFVDQAKIFHGFKGVATEIFNSLPDLNSGLPVDQSGIEYWTSGRNIPKQLAKLGVNVKDASEAFKLKDSNKVVASYFEDYKKRMAAFLATAVYFYDPEYIVVGGSVAMHNQAFFKEIFDLATKITANVDSGTKFAFAQDMENSILMAAANLDSVKEFF